ncbi:hypothetical protein DSUL_20524 [Desulfovibrionales bacterium]
MNYGTSGVVSPDVYRLAVYGLSILQWSHSHNLWIARACVFLAHLRVTWLMLTVYAVGCCGFVWPIMTPDDCDLGESVYPVVGSIRVRRGLNLSISSVDFGQSLNTHASYYLALS